MHASLRGHIDIVVLLLQAGADIKAKNKVLSLMLRVKSYFRIFLLYIIFFFTSNCFAFCEILQDGKSALDCAYESGYTDVVEFLEE